MIEINAIIDDNTQAVQDAVEKGVIANLRHFSSRVVNSARRSIQPSMEATGLGNASLYSGLQQVLIGRSNFSRTIHAKPGEPPRSRLQSGKNIRDAIISNDPRGIHQILASRNATQVGFNPVAQVGTNKTEIGNIGEVMEFGGSYKGEHYAPHPFIRPAFDREIASIAGDWSGSFGG